MKYSKELHEHARTRIHDQGEVISFGTPFVECLLNEIERLKEERRWIPVSERLPVQDEVVLTLNSELEIYLVSEYDYVLEFVEIAERRMVDVTHWMPLPESPDAS